MGLHQIGDFARLVRQATGQECTQTHLKDMEKAEILPPVIRVNAGRGARLYDDEIHLPKACLALALRKADLTYDYIKKIFEGLDAEPEEQVNIFWSTVIERLTANEALAVMRLRIARVIAQDLTKWTLGDRLRTSWEK